MEDKENLFGSIIFIRKWQRLQGSYKINSFVILNWWFIKVADFSAVYDCDFLHLSDNIDWSHYYQ